jgi:hypothetical protein
LFPKSSHALSALSLPEIFLGAHLGFGGWCFHVFVTGSKSPAQQEGCLCQALPDTVDLGKELIFWQAAEASSGYTKEPEKFQVPTWESYLSDR